MIRPVTAPLPPRRAVVTLAVENMFGRSPETTPLMVHPANAVRQDRTKPTKKAVEADAKDDEDAVAEAALQAQMASITRADERIALKAAERAKRLRKAARRGGVGGSSDEDDALPKDLSMIGSRIQNIHAVMTSQMPEEDLDGKLRYSRDDVTVECDVMHCGMILATDDAGDRLITKAVLSHVSADSNVATRRIKRTRGRSRAGSGAGSEGSGREAGLQSPKRGSRARAESDSDRFSVGSSQSSGSVFTVGTATTGMTNEVLSAIGTRRASQVSVGSQTSDRLTSRRESLASSLAASQYLRTRDGLTRRSSMASSGSRNLGRGRAGILSARKGSAYGSASVDGDSDEVSTSSGSSSEFGVDDLDPLDRYYDAAPRPTFVSGVIPDAMFKMYRDRPVYVPEEDEEEDDDFFSSEGTSPRALMSRDASPRAGDAASGGSAAAMGAAALTGLSLAKLKGLAALTKGASAGAGSGGVSFGIMAKLRSKAKQAKVVTRKRAAKPANQFAQRRAQRQAAASKILAPSAYDKLPGLLHMTTASFNTKAESVVQAENQRLLAKGLHATFTASAFNAVFGYGLASAHRRMEKKFLRRQYLRPFATLLEALRRRVEEKYAEPILNTQNCHQLGSLFCSTVTQCMPAFVEHYQESLPLIRQLLSLGVKLFYFFTKLSHPSGWITYLLDDADAVTREFKELDDAVVDAFARIPLPSLLPLMSAACLPREYVHPHVLYDLSLVHSRMNADFVKPKSGTENAPKTKAIDALCKGIRIPTDNAVRTVVGRALERATIQRRKKLEEQGMDGGVAADTDLTEMELIEKNLKKEMRKQKRRDAKKRAARAQDRVARMTGS